LTSSSSSSGGFTAVVAVGRATGVDMEMWLAVMRVRLAV